MSSLSLRKRARKRKPEVEGTEITTYAIRAPNCCRRVTGDYFLIAAIKREQDHHASVRALVAFDVRTGRNAFSTRETARENDLRGGSNIWREQRVCSPWD